MAKWILYFIWGVFCGATRHRTFGRAPLESLNVAGFGSSRLDLASICCSHRFGQERFVNAAREAFDLFHPGLPLEHPSR